MATERFYFLGKVYWWTMMNNFELIQLNPIPIMVLDVDNLFTQQEINTLINLNFILHPQSETQVSNNQNILLNKDLQNIKNKFDEAIKKYTEILSIENKFTMVHSWLTKNEPNSAHPVHNHPNVMLSLVSYFNKNNVEQEFSGLTIMGSGLKNTFYDLNFTMNIKSWNNINSQAWTIIPKTNQIIVFPSYLTHSSVPNDSSETRYCLASNYFVDGKIGNSYVDSINVNIN